MELGPKRPSLLWFCGPDSILVVYMDPLGRMFNNATWKPSTPCRSSARLGRRSDSQRAAAAHTGAAARLGGACVRVLGVMMVRV